MAFALRDTDLGRLNSATKYPSIATYHQLDPANGGLLEIATPYAQAALATEKIDGTNARMIFLPDQSYLLGSREELLYARGDLIGNPALGIVDALRADAERLVGQLASADAITVVYGELYGGKVTGASKQYTGERRVGYRVFDVVRLPLASYQELLAWEPQQIAQWREQGGQPFLPEEALQQLAADAGLPVTPRLFSIEPGELPQSIDAALALLRERLPRSLSALDEGAGGQPEGIVLRTLDRATIAKLRYEDYERTIRRRGGAGRQR
ncbi:hypothetical protein F8S13_08980 [Chloroflexia bacterium SDU3-3]|nr:hypothetical protein F8S13_08980 [Chloroflexia bacterium SDU3-3]